MPASGPSFTPTRCSLHPRPRPSAYSSESRLGSPLGFSCHYTNWHLRRGSPHPHHLTECCESGRFRQRFLCVAIAGFRLAASDRNGVASLAAFPSGSRQTSSQCLPAEYASCVSRSTHAPIGDYSPTLRGARYMLARRGEMTPPCGVPISG